MRPPLVVTYAPVMEGPRSLASSPAAWLVLAGALLASASARAAEPWPPATPPRVDLTDAPVAPKPKAPAPVTPVSVVAPTPVPAAAPAPAVAPAPVPAAAPAP